MTKEEKEFFAELIATKNSKKGVLENLNITSIFQVLIISGVIGFVGNYISTNKQNIIQEQFNAQIEKDMKDLSKGLTKISDKVEENTKIERYTKFNAQDDLNPLILKITALEQENLKIEEWSEQIDNFKQQVNLELELIKANNSKI